MDDMIIASLYTIYIIVGIILHKKNKSDPRSEGIYFWGSIFICILLWSMVYFGV